MSAEAARRDRIVGRTQFVADLTVPGVLHAAVVRSPVPHAIVRSVQINTAVRSDGVVAVVRAQDVTTRLTGRHVHDMPVLASNRVRFVGEPVAAVVATTRRAAEEAARLVRLDLDPLPAVLGPVAALGADAVAVHPRPWEYVGSVAAPDWHANLQSSSEVGEAGVALAALDRAVHAVDLTVVCAGGHQGYLEQHACVADWDGQRGRVWMTGKSPYATRRQLGALFGVEMDAIELMAAPVGGDFGGKGASLLAPLCMELSRVVRRPVRLVLRYGEELTATNPRHPGELRIRLGCDEHGRLVAGSLDATMDGGAYAGMLPRATVELGGVIGAIRAYAIPDVHVRSRLVYTNTVPRGHMRAPGHPQAAFAVEQAVDALADLVGMSALDMRAANLAQSGGVSSVGSRWRGGAGPAVLDAARPSMAAEPPSMPEGPAWRHGRGVALCLRLGPVGLRTSMRVLAVDGRVRAEVPFPDTGTGSVGVVARLVAEALGIAAELVDVVQVSTDALPGDSGVGHSRVTLSVASAVDEVARLWRGGESDVAVDLALDGAAAGPPVATHCVQVADVAVDVETGEVRVLRLTTVLEVGRIINAAAHDMQVDGGALMGVGFALLEDLDEAEGRIGADTLSEFHLPTTLDLPELVTVRVSAADPTAVLPVGELANVAVAPALANAIFEAVGERPLRTPIRAEQVHAALQGRSTCA